MAFGSRAFLLQDLATNLFAGDAVKIAHHGGIGMRAEHAAQQVVRGAHVRDPVAHGFVDGVLQRLRTGADAAHLRAKQAHAVDVQFLPAHVLFTHVDDALHAKQRANGRGGHAVLAGAGLRDDAVLAHALREQPLAEAVVDLVRAGVQQVFALEIDFCAAQAFGEPRRKIKRRGAASVIAQQRVQLRTEDGIGLCLLVRALQLFKRGHQCFRNVAATVVAKTPGTGLGQGLHAICLSLLGYRVSDGADGADSGDGRKPPSRCG